MLPRLSSFLSAVIVTLCSLALSPGAFGQNLTFGVLVGASLTDDYRTTTIPFLGIATQQTSNASQWFMVGPMAELGLPKNFSLELDAIRRKIRSSQLTVLSPPLQLSFGPFITDSAPWQFSLLGKYRFAARDMRPFVEVGPSLLPRQNRSQAGITAGSGVEIPVWRMNIAPTLRYTRWVNNQSLGGVSDQFQFLVGVHETSTSLQPRIFGRPLSLGIVSGFSLTKLLRELDAPITVSSSHTAVVGIMIDVWLFDNLFLEVDGLFRPAHTIEEIKIPDGSLRESRAAFLTWEFPMLAKYTTPSSVAPIIEFGPSFRSIANANSDNYSHSGITGGVGVAAHLGALSIAPTIRFTRWGADNSPLGLAPMPGTHPNQLELVVGFSF